MRLWLPLLLILTTSCGFRFGENELSKRYKTITVPYPEGDYNGHLANQLVREISRSGAFRYSRKEGELILSVRIVDFYEKDIGFRFDVDSSDDFTERLLPAEGRMVAYAEVKVIEASSGRVLLGPAVVRGITDYDHDYYATKERAFRFSLGQLDDLDVAREQALEPLNRALAQRIVDLITSPVVL